MCTSSTESRNFFPCPSTCAASVFCSKRCCHQHARTHANLNSGQKSPPVSIVLFSIPASYKVLECACKFGTLVRSCMGMFWFSGVCSCSTGCMLSNKHSFIEKNTLKEPHGHVTQATKQCKHVPPLPPVVMKREGDGDQPLHFVILITSLFLAPLSSPLRILRMKKSCKSRPWTSW